MNRDGHSLFSIGKIELAQVCSLGGRAVKFDKTGLQVLLTIDVRGISVRDNYLLTFSLRQLVIKALSRSTICATL